MSKFNGKNELESTIQLAIERAKYKVEAFPQRNGIGPVQVTDFTFAEYVNYGRIDANMESVYLDTSNLSTITVPNSETSIALLSFVATAFKDLVKDFENAATLGVIPSNDEFLSKILPTRGYTDVLLSYEEYLNDHIDSYVTTYIIEENRTEHILSFHDFVNNFLIYMKHRREMPIITLTSWQRSRFSSVFHSGLAVSVADLPFGDDSYKQQFISNIAFNYFKKVCMKRGFAISHNSPWVIVADLKSPQMIKYYAKDNYINQPQQVFNLFYKKAYIDDIRLLKLHLMRNYNDFADSFEFEKITRFCKNNKLQSMFKKRSTMNLEQIDKKYPFSYWLKRYAKIRNMEENHLFTDKVLDKKIKYALNYKKSVDILGSLNYINEEFRITYKDKYGGLNSIIEKQNEQKKFKNK